MAYLLCLKMKQENYPKMKNKILTIVGLLLLFNSYSHAENEISLYSGIQTLPHATITGTADGSSVNETIGWKGKSFTTPPYYGFRYINWINDGGFGIEFTHAKAYAPTNEMPTGFTRLEFTDGLNLITANYHRRWKQESYSPFITAGIGFAVPHVDITVNNKETYGYQLTGAAARVGGGVSYPISKKYDIYGEYQFTYSMHDVELDNSVGDLAVNLITNALNVGVSRKF